MSDLLARRERAALCDLALRHGADAPTLCGDWDAAHLMAHLFVREQRPVSAVGIAVPPLAGLTARAMDRALARGFDALVERVRRPGLTPFALPPVDALVNTLEYVVHHEDLRRAQPDWSPRELAPADLDTVWSALGRVVRVLVRGAGVPVVIERTDTGVSRTGRGGRDPVRVRGGVVELTMWLYGRAEVRDVELDGPPASVARLREAPRGM